MFDQIVKNYKFSSANLPKILKLVKQTLDCIVFEFLFYFLVIIKVEKWSESLNITHLNVNNNNNNLNLFNVTQLIDTKL